MFKKIMRLTVLLGLLGLPLGAYAQNSGGEIFKNQAPLTETEVELFCNHIETISAMNQSDKFELGLSKIGLPKDRFNYLFTKIAIFNEVEAGEVKEGQMPPYALPTSEERKILLKHKGEIADGMKKIKAGLSQEAGGEL